MGRCLIPKEDNTLVQNHGREESNISNTTTVIPQKVCTAQKKHFHPLMYMACNKFSASFMLLLLLLLLGGGARKQHF
jgi:hypothetical protein